MLQPKIAIISASGTLEFSQQLGSILNIPVFPIYPEKFPNQELKLRLDQIGDTTILIGSLSAPVNTRIMEFVLAADAIKRLGCKRLIGVINYLAYSKQDKVFLPGEPLSAKVVADIIQTSAISELITIDLHNPHIADYFTIPVHNLSAVSLLAKTALSNIKPNSVVVSPDKGSQKNSKLFADYLEIPQVLATKNRNLNTGQVTIMELSQDVKGFNVYIYDDMIATGHTLIKLAQFLKSKGAKSINVYCTHHLYLNQVQSNIDNSPIDHLTVTNTIIPEHLTSLKLNILDCASIIGDELIKLLAK